MSGRCDSMADAQHLYCLRKDDASQVVPVRDRTSAHRIDTACSCELNGRLSLRVFGRSPHESPRFSTPQRSPSVTYIPGLFCHPCPRSHAQVRALTYLDADVERGYPCDGVIGSRYGWV